MKTPIPYFGAKQNIAKQIVNLMPAHSGYVEPYAGSLAVLFEKPPCALEVVNDIDERLVTFWQVLRDRPDDFIHLVEFTPHSKSVMLDASKLDAEDDVLLAWQVWVTLTQGRAHTLRSRPGWRRTVRGTGTSAPFATYMSAYRERILPAVDRLRNVQIESAPALSVIEQYGAVEDTVMYVDPPYLGEVRGKDEYAHDMMSEAEHRRLADALNAVRSTVILSGYASPLYAELYEGWHRHEIGASTGNATSSDRTEVLWSNRPVGDFLFDVIEGVA